jgi:hypothetical protein
MGARNRVKVGLSYPPARLHKLAKIDSQESIPVPEVIDPVLGSFSRKLDL